MKLTITYLKTGDLLPYASNSRTHSSEQVAQIAASIKEFGFATPICVAEGTILAGHGRVMAAKKLGMEEVPTVDLSHLTPAQRRAYVIADNKLALNAGWDEEILAAEIERLKEDEFDVSVLGFSDEELAEMASETNEGLTDPDETPEPPEQPVSVLGDVWVMGKHRIICGSSTDAHTVEKVLAGAKPHLMVTDPPYGVEYDASWRTEAGINKKHQNVATGVVMNDDRADWREAWALFTGDVAYVWHAGSFSPTVAESLSACEFEIRALIIWAKPSLVMGRGHYHHQHEPCWYMVRKGGTGHWAGDRKQTTLWQIANMHASQGNVDDGKTKHSTQKPIECMKRPIENNSVEGDHIYEPFSGSGTTLIAGEMTGRHVHAIELNPAYVDIAVTRWQKFTGKQAVNEATGKTFDETKAKMKGTNEKPN